jgi:hypothetical protein
MTPKAIASYVGGIATFVLVAWLLRGRVTDALAFGIAGLAMLLVGFPFTRHLSGKQITFTRWILFSVLGALAGIVVFVAIGRLG